MPRVQPPPILRLCGLALQGDLGPWTCYEYPGRHLVIFESTAPSKPPTRRQQHQRNKLRLAARAWTLLSPTARRAIGLAARRAYLTITGYNLYVAYSMRADPSVLRTVERQSHTTIPLP